MAGLRLPFTGTRPVSQGFGLPAHVKEPAGWLALDDGKEWRYRRTAFDGATKHPHVHPGMDWAMPVGTPLLAAEAGTIVARGVYLSTGERYVMLEIRPGTILFYTHLSKVRRDVGEKVGRGAVIALSGDSGISTGPHLHFEVRRGLVAPAFRYNPRRLLTGGDHADAPWIRPL